jgi:predicted phosphohydrolase
VYALQNDSVQIDDVVFAGTRGWRVPERRQTQSDEDKKIYEREIIRFELALKDAKIRMDAQGGQTGGNAPLIGILHYPPFNATQDASPFTELCEKYGVTACVYGHLHGKQGRTQHVVHRNGVTYYLTSCDHLNHTVAEIKI